MDTKSNILPIGAGERAAMGGYLPQYVRGIKRNV